MKLTLREIIILFEELNGRLINQQTNERTKGILSHKLSIRAKYILNNELNKKIIDIIKNYEEARLDIFKELGTLNNDVYEVPEDKRSELGLKIFELESIEHDIEVPKLDVEELYNIQTEDYFPILLDKLLATV
jgi:hypothetical protein